MGRRLRAPPSPRPRWRTASGPAPTTASPSTATGGDVFIETTRPELLAACVALVAHPDDERYQPLFGTTVRTPLYGVEVPVVAHHLAQPDKGTGIAMICTFGDLTDVTWWRELQLPTRAIVGRDGRLLRRRARRDHVRRPGRGVRDDRRADREAGPAHASSSSSPASGEMIGEATPITHPVKFYERGDRPLEIVTSRQWYIGNGGRDLAAARRARRPRRRAGVASRAHAPPLHELGRGPQRRLADQPSALVRRAAARSGTRSTPPATRTTTSRSCPPTTGCRSIRRTDVPDGYTADQRDQPGGFTRRPRRDGHVGDVVADAADRRPLDVAPTSPTCSSGCSRWTCARRATTSSAPGCSRRSCAATSSTARVPWRNAALSGWILDPDRKKMSKSKGNVVTPLEPFDKYGADAVRYWAASARLGVDTAYSEDQMKVGRKLATKLLNVSKFVLGFPWSTATEPDGYEPVDASMLARLDGVIDAATTAFAGYDHARALEVTESFFWWFCDDYVELVKSRAYGARVGAATSSAVSALRTAIVALQRMLAPFLPFVTDEVWSWWQPIETPAGTIHLAPWPAPHGRRRRRRRCSTRSARCWPWCGGPRPRPRPTSAPRSPSCAIAAPARGRTPPSAPRRPTSGRRHDRDDHVLVEATRSPPRSPSPRYPPSSRSAFGRWSDQKRTEILRWRERSPSLPSMRLDWVGGTVGP